MYQWGGDANSLDFSCTKKRSKSAKEVLWRQQVGNSDDDGDAVTRTHKISPTKNLFRFT